MESDTANKSMPEIKEPKPKDFFNRLGGVYFTPKDTFKEIGGAPRVLVPLIILIIFTSLISFYLSKTLDLESMVVARMQEMVEQGRITQEQMDQQLAMVSKFGGMGYAWAALFSIIAALIIAGFAKLFSNLAGAENRFKTLFSVTVFALLAVSIIQRGLMVLIVFLKGPGEIDSANMTSIVVSNLGAILAIILGDDALPKFIMDLANAVDIFTIWKIALLAIGYSAVSRKLKASTAAVWLGGAYAIIAVIIAAVGSLFTMPGGR